jgi:outer membrane protein insertion porin family
MNALASAGQQTQYATNNGQVSIVGTNSIPGQTPIFLQQAGKTLVSSLNWTLSHDTRNNVMLPTRGHLVQFEPMLAGGPLGGQASFYQLEIKAAQYWSPANFFSPASDIYETFKNHILELVGNIGVVNAYGSGDRGLRGVTPIFNRYYLGGMYSLRGFRFREVGPKQDFTAEPYGGGTFWYGSSEYSVPVIPRVRFAAFFDVGMVYPDAYSFQPSQYLNGTTTGLYNSNWGVGLRLNLPIGPLRLDYGIPIVSDQYNRSSGQFQFGVGYTRDF